MCWKCQCWRCWRHDSSPYDMGGMLPRDIAIPQPMPIIALASGLANAMPEQLRTMLGENLYPLVDQLEHEHAAKVTGMLLEMCYDMWAASAWTWTIMFFIFGL
ncbi:polyadenylate-binding 2-like [Olea europaea subsp. europaea]|uniref:Polyadenylate-binding 2-like n=1 Tax=Olea europaea subsp. europaea TaxID=158383 RepID=A0A8S0QWB4_OLEEU|nr:polyadenylate-binding 2-like [Olea europaea subsp. europaea]